MEVVKRNNNHQSSLPPRIADIEAWYGAEWALIDSQKKVDSALDMSDWGAHLDEHLAQDKPGIGSVLPLQFNGKRTFNFTVQNRDIEEHQLIGTANFKDIFGNASPWTTDPTFTIIGVLSEGASSAGSETIFKMSNPGIANFNIERNISGIRVLLRNSAGTTSDTADKNWLVSTAQTFVCTVRFIIGGSEVHMWVGADKLVWDGTVSDKINIPSGTMGGVDTVNFGNKAWFGSIGEFILFNGSFTDAEVSSAQNYLRDKWNCT